MYRKYPKKHTRVYKYHRWSYYDRDYKKMAKGMNAELRRTHKTIEKMELKKLSINCEDEDIEKYLIRAQFVPIYVWYEFD